MIIYDLACENGHVFESWFERADGYEAQLAGGMLSCPQCDSRVLRKIPSGAKFIKRTGDSPRPAPASSAQAGKALMNYVRRHARDVGEAFPETVRRIHYGESDAESVYGKATPQEVMELHEEGIDVLPLGSAKEGLQ